MLYANNVRHFLAQELNQVAQYFVRTRKGRNRSRLIIPEPFFVHSDLTTMAQVADLIAYILSWGVWLTGMSAPKRDELDELAAKVMRLRFTQHTPGGYTNYGFKIINARKHGRNPGRPTLPPETISALQDLVGAGKSVAQAAKHLGIGRSTAYKVIRNTTQ